jgi:hypothetical protein
MLWLNFMCDNIRHTYVLDLNSSNHWLSVFEKVNIVVRNGNVKVIYIRYMFNICETYPQNKFRLQILPLKRCGHYGAHACRVWWSFWKAWMQFADNRTTFTHRSVCLKCSRKSLSPPNVKCSLQSVSSKKETWNRLTFIINFVSCMENMP